MRVTCPECSANYDDEFRITLCPHQAFWANDGHNNFALHNESVITFPDATGKDQ